MKTLMAKSYYVISARNGLFISAEKQKTNNFENIFDLF